MSFQRPLDLAQPLEIHPLRCDCHSCNDEADQPSVLYVFAVSTVAAIGAGIFGQVMGVALNRAGILALLGIG
jgi:hypothetical protein